MNTRIKVLRSQFRYHSRRVKKKIFNPLAYQVSKRAFEKRKEEFAELETFLLFIGYPRSGHSLIASILDAHPQVCLSDELDVLNFLRQGYSPGQIFYLISEHSRRFTQSGRSLSGYSYQVPDSWQGRHRNLKVIGDKSAYEVNQVFQNTGSLPQRLPGRIGLKIKYVHVIRNPFDQITTDARMGNLVQREVNGADIQHQIGRHFRDLDCVNQLRNQNGIELIDIHLEDFIQAPKKSLARLCDFVHVRFDDEYLEKCASIVFSRPHQSRFEAMWDSGQIRQVEAKIAQTPFLKGYTFREENG